ncbi:MAG: hypothetical protein QXV24_00010 [Nitrososphaerota archaeon]
MHSTVVIKNLNNLISRGNKSGRKIVLDVIEHALKTIDSYELTKKLVHRLYAPLYAPQTNLVNAR